MVSSCARGNLSFPSSFVGNPFSSFRQCSRAGIQEDDDLKMLDARQKISGMTVVEGCARLHHAYAEKLGITKQFAMEKVSKMFNWFPQSAPGRLK